MISIEDAIILAANAHKGQVDLDGKPYILHPLAVGNKGTTREEMVTGYLHDILEDTSVSVIDMRLAGVDPEIIGALLLLTHVKGELYMDYLKRIKESGNKLALKVKLNDIDHNISRNDRSTPKKLGIFKKHLQALRYLEGKS